MSPDMSSADWLEPVASLTDATHSFIVIIRHHPLPSSQPNGQTAGWHGSVEHSQTHERIYFMDYARLNAFIAARSETILHTPWRARLTRQWRETGLHQRLRRLLGGRLRFALPGKAGPAD